MGKNTPEQPVYRESKLNPYPDTLLINALTGQVPTVGLNRSFIRQDEQIANTFAVGAFFIAVIPGCLTERTFVPIRYFSSN